MNDAIDAIIKEKILDYLADGQEYRLRQVQCGINIVVLSQQLLNNIDELVQAGEIERVNGGVVRMKDKQDE